VTADFVAAMEEVLDLYATPYDPLHPKVNFDEMSKQLIEETRAVLAAEVGQLERFDYEYKRNGTRNLFVLCEPQAGWRHLAITERRTKLDFAAQMKWLADEKYPEAETIEVILDNLNTHKAASLYEAFAPEEARRLLRKIKFHYTPKHGSWLNMAEIEFSILQRQCLARRIGDEAILATEVAAYEERRNREKAQIDWRFSLADARTKLKRLYPSTS